MATAPYSGKVFELMHKRMTFVDAINENGSRPGPPMIINKKGSKADMPYDYHPLTDSGAFILSFLLHRVDTDLIKQIYMSEYGLTGASGESIANIDIKALIDDLTSTPKKLLKEVPRRTQGHQAPQVGPVKPFATDYPDGLEPKFKVGLNQMGGYIHKYPT